MAIKKRSVPIDETEIEGLGIITKGKLVSHPIFGNGKVEGLAQWESGDITINVVFDKIGSKWLVPEFAKLTEQAPQEPLKAKGSFFSRLFKRSGT